MTVVPTGAMRGEDSNRQPADAKAISFVGPSASAYGSGLYRLLVSATASVDCSREN
jgi:hypothetical protein